MIGDRPVIGLTGGIGSGKSTVAGMLGAMGALIVDSDRLAREAMGEPGVQATLRAWWGDQVFAENGEIDRSAVAGIVFSDQAWRRRLESLIHPIVEARRRAMFDAAPASILAFVIDAPLLLEAGVDRECDAVIFVDAPETLRLERVKSTRGWDAAELRRREANQIPLDEKRRRADHTVVNTGDLASLSEQVRAVFGQILSRQQT